MSTITRKKIDSEIESKIILCMIVSDDFCKRVIPIVANDKYFESNVYRSMFINIRKYFQKYDKSPGKSILDLLSIDSKFTEQELISIKNFIDNIPFEKEHVEFDIDYFVDKVLEYFRKRSLDLLQEEVNLLKESGGIDRAEEIIKAYRPPVEESPSSYVRIFSEENVKEVFEVLNSGYDRILKFPGDYGEFLGWLGRGWLAGVAAGWKKGKTWQMIEVVIQSLANRKKVLFIELEMPKNQMSMRFFRTITSLGSTTDCYIPVFDCTLNQNNSCAKQERICKVAVNENGYKPCTYCRYHNPEIFQPTSFIEKINKPVINQNAVIRKIKTMEKFDQTDLILYPIHPYGINVAGIDKHMEYLERTQGLKFDVVVIDYADKLAPEDARIAGLDRTDMTWCALKGLAMKRDCLVFTGSQITKSAMGKNLLDGNDSYGDSRKMAHVDMFLGLNQSNEEKEKGIMRINLLAYREGEFLQSKECTILQQLDFGQFMLDSFVIGGIKKKNKGDLEDF